MKIVVLDGYTLFPGDLDMGTLEALGEVSFYDRTPPELVVSRIGDAPVVLTNKTRITREVMLACPQLKYIGVLATGYNVVDIEAAGELGVVVTNVPAYSTQAVAQHTMALLLASASHVQAYDAAVKDGAWSRSPDFCFYVSASEELAGKTMGIIGFGSIGQSVGRIAKALGMRVITHSRSVKEEGKLIADYVELETLLRESDVISLHCPLFPETKDIINRDNIAKMKDGVIIINNSRGGLVVEQDLADALNSGKVAAAGVDVVSEEPIKGTNPLLSAKNCFITPHISWAPKESRQRIMDATVNNIRSYLDGAAVNVVNP